MFNQSNNNHPDQTRLRESSGDRRPAQRNQIFGTKIPLSFLPIQINTCKDEGSESYMKQLEGVLKGRVTLSLFIYETYYRKTNYGCVTILKRLRSSRGSNISL